MIIDMETTTIATQVTELTGKAVRRVRLTENSVLVRVHLGNLGVNKSVNALDISVSSEEDLIKVHKRLLKSPELNELSKLDAQIRKFIYSRILKPGTFGSGIYFLGLALAKDFEAQMRLFKDQRQALVDTICLRYDRLISEDKEKLSAVKVGDQAVDCFNDSDYPPVETVRKRFEMTWQYLALIPPKSLEAVSEDLYLQAKDQMQKEIEDATEAVRYALRAEVKQFVDWCIERLNPNAPGQKKVITTKMTNRVTEFLELFSGRDITNDFELKALVDKARVIMMGVTAEGLRASEDLRTTLKSGFGDIKSILDTWVIDQADRAIEVD